MFAGLLQFAIDAVGVQGKARQEFRVMANATDGWAAVEKLAQIGECFSGRVKSWSAMTSTGACTHSVQLQADGSGWSCGQGTNKQQGIKLS